MATVHETTIPSKAFYARFHDESGYLTKMMVTYSSWPMARPHRT